MTIPSNYKDLSGFKTSYSETELRIAIAVAEVLIANNLGGGGSSGSGITQSEVTSAINAATNVDAIESDADAILAILSSGVTTRALARTQSPTATGTINTSGDNTIIAAPGAGQRIYITKLQIQLEASTATTVLIRSGATAIGRIRCVADGDGKIETYSPGFERRLGANEALIFNLSGANSVGFEVEYYTGS